MKYLLFIPLFFLFGFESKAQQPGDIFFNQPLIHEIKLNFWQSAYWDSLTANYSTDTYMKCSVEIDGITIDTIGAKFKGNSSYNNPSDKKPFKLDLNDYISSANIDGLKKLNLNNGFKDPSFLREKLTLDFYNEHGIVAPRCAYAKVFINNTYWGLYTVVEEVDKTFLDGRFADNDGNLFKGDPQGDLKWINNQASSYYPKYELHTNETQNNWSDLVNFIKQVNSPAGMFYDSLNAVFHSDDFLRSWAGTALFANLDSYIGSGHNYFIYHDSTTNKFRWIIWDVNEAFGNFNMGMQPAQLIALGYDYVNNPNNRPLCNNMRNNAVFHAALGEAMCELVYPGFSNAALDGKIDSLANQIRPHVYADTKKFFSNQHFEDNIVQDIVVSGTPGGSNILGIKSFISARRSNLETQLNAIGCFAGLNENDNREIPVFPNPSQNEIVLLSGIQEAYFLYNAQGELTEKGMLKKGSNQISGPEVPGIYWLKTESGKAQKIIRY